MGPGDVPTGLVMFSIGAPILAVMVVFAMRYGALAFRPEDTDLRDAVNKQLHAWIGTPDHLATVAPFGFDKSNLPTKTTAQLCGG